MATAAGAADFPGAGPVGSAGPEPGGAQTAGTGIAGVAAIGVDVVAVDRFAAALRRTPTLADRLFVAAERITDSGATRTATSMAARFAAKEAVAKALGVPRGMDWHDCIVHTTDGGAPHLSMRGTVAAACAAAGIADWRISLSHDGPVAIAFVVALR